MSGQVKGWCPGAYRPMMAADGLVVRIRPRCARLTVAQALGLCDLAQRFGRGDLDLTNRANVQIRGVAERDHDALLEALAGLDVLDADPDAEQRRNLLVMPFWAAGDLTSRVAGKITARLMELPELPAKVGIAVDCGLQRMLTQDPADFRIEQGAEGLILRADGVAEGRAVTEETVFEALCEMAEWFNAHRSETHRRMARVVKHIPLPAAWRTAKPHEAAERAQIGSHPMGALIGAPFGQVNASALARLLSDTNTPGLRITPWRALLLEGANMPDAPTLITRPDDPLNRVDACPGAPFCPSASVETRPLARALAGRVQGTLHVSGCAKGCARARAADVTLVGREGRFDLVRNGKAGDTPLQSGLSPEDLRVGDAF